MAPASTKYHGAYVGGLYDHSYMVTKNLLHLTESLGLLWEKKRSPYIVGMLHDICKCHMYIANDTGFEYNRDLYLPGHGDRSVILAQRLVRLTEEEILCIRWHMGAFDDKEHWNAYGCARLSRWTASHMTIVYPLAAPEVVQLTTAQLTALRSLRGRKGQTNLYSADPAGPEIRAEMYIDIPTYIAGLMG